MPPPLDTKHGISPRWAMESHHVNDRETRREFLVELMAADSGSGTEIDSIRWPGAQLI
jgi:hypothetical protein